MLIGLDRPLDVVADEKIDLPVVVVVEPRRARRKPRLREASPRRHVCKLPIPEIAKQMIWTNAGDVDIVVAVVVVVGNGDADAVHRSEEHTSELQSQSNLVCRLLLEKKNKI